MTAGSWAQGMLVDLAFEGVHCSILEAVVVGMIDQDSKVAAAVGYILHLEEGEHHYNSQAAVAVDCNMAVEPLLLSVMRRSIGEEAT